MEFMCRFQLAKANPMAQYKCTEMTQILAEINNPAAASAKVNGSSLQGPFFLLAQVFRVIGAVDSF